MPFCWLLLTLCFAWELLPQLPTFTGRTSTEQLRQLRLAQHAERDKDSGTPATKLRNTASAALKANQAFYEAFNKRDLEAMSKLWASEVTKWGPLLFFQDRDRTFKMTCTCTHPDSSRLQGRPEIMTSWNRIFSSSTLPSIQISKEQVLVTCEDMAVVVCQEETSDGGTHEATNTFARGEGGIWYIIGHQAGPVEL
ncbi:unnamed protein product [Cladocopium goreaui]|uniref:Serine/threonine-protein phosphatase n=1 Tax=Cladocopium goreaui TaxID=2562237 RepID=A0A9P1CAA0_9DINO|nr:unnamed protein product [Cladocopium goreaui]